MTEKVIRFLGKKSVTSSVTVTGDNLSVATDARKQSTPLTLFIYVTEQEYRT